MSKSPHFAKASRGKQSKRGIADLLLLGVLAVVALVAAGYFLFGQSFMTPVANFGREIGLPIATPTRGDDAASLEKDINDTEFSSIDSELSNLEKELGASLTE